MRLAAGTGGLWVLDCLELEDARPAEPFPGLFVYSVLPPRHVITSSLPLLSPWLLSTLRLAQEGCNPLITSLPASLSEASWNCSPCFAQKKMKGEWTSSGSNICQHEGDGRMWVAIRQALIPAQFKVLAGRSSRCVLYSPRSNRGVCVCVWFLHVCPCSGMSVCGVLWVGPCVFLCVCLCASVCFYVCLCVCLCKRKGRGRRGRMIRR